VESSSKRIKVATTWYVANAAMNFVGFVSANGKTTMEQLVVIINAISTKS
jgi:hypothetical protein